MSKLWSIPIISVYLYGLTILTQYGYNSYFNIPSSFLDASISYNFVYFFQIFQLVKAIFGAITWWLWILLLLGLIAILFVLASHWIWQRISYYGFILGLFAILVGSFNFGGLLASHTEDFYILSTGCVTGSSEPDGLIHIVPTFYREFAIVTPITNEKKLTDSFYLHPASDNSCILKREAIGRVN